MGFGIGRGRQNKNRQEQRRSPPSPQPSPPPIVLEHVDYDTYINSPAWSAFRQRWFSDRSLPNACLACGITTGLELHHVTYERLGNERLTDLIPFCRRCHKEFHERFTSHQCTGLDEFEGQLRVAFRLDGYVAKLRLRPWFQFGPNKVLKPAAARKAEKMKRREQRAAANQEKKAKQKMSSALRFQAYHDKHSPRRHDPFA